MTKVYCHTNYFDYSNNPRDRFLVNNWYTLHSETNELYIIQHCGSLFRFYKSPIFVYYQIFSKFFYTEQEYNRIKNLNELIND